MVSPSSSSAKSQLFVNLVDQLLESQVYAAEEVGYSYSLSASPHGLTLSFSGLSDPVIFGKFINLVTSGECLSAHLSFSLYHCVCDTFFPSSLLPFFPSSLPCTHMHTVLGHITKQSERYKIFILAEDSETDYLMNYNLTTLPYQYYRYIQS